MSYTFFAYECFIESGVRWCRIPDSVVSISDTVGVLTREINIG